MYDTLFDCSDAATDKNVLHHQQEAKDDQLKVIVGAVLLDKNDYKLG
ncbi:hypothetical protein [Desulfosporosinus sp. SYSU MS00001]